MQIYFVVMRSTQLPNWDASDHDVLGVFGKLLRRRSDDAWALFGSMKFGLAVQKFLNIE
jgi:hypothetical protein